MPCKFLGGYMESNSKDNIENFQDEQGEDFEIFVLEKINQPTLQHDQ